MTYTVSSGTLNLTQPKPYNPPAIVLCVQESWMYCGGDAEGKTSVAPVGWSTGHLPHWQRMPARVHTPS